MLRDPKLGAADVSSIDKRKSIIEWKRLCSWPLKFNVDGTAKGNSREIGSGGALRDDCGKIMNLLTKGLRLVSLKI